ncbi:MAG: tripartite tricarboxylate transporter TctB family protein [Candidatus Omnitrophota bacterium]
MKMRLSKDSLIGLGILAISGLIYGETFTFTRHESGVSPQFFPRLLTGLLAFFSLFLIIRSKQPDTTGLSGEDTLSSRRGKMTIAIAFGALAAYAFFIPLLGYFLSTAIYLVFMIRYLGERKIGRIAAWSMGTAYAIAFVFMTILDVQTPEWGWIRMLLLAKPE